MKLGVFIGSFNPPHSEHEEMVDTLINSKTIDKVIVIPVGDNYSLKNNLLEYNHRYNMSKLAFEEKNVIVSDLERERYHYTHENIYLLKEKYLDDELYLIIGADNLIELHTWKNYEYILENCHFIIYKRNNLDVISHINKYFTIYSNKFIIKEQLDSVSSTLIRERIKNNLNVDKYLNKKVTAYIKDNNLYKGE